MAGTGERHSGMVARARRPFTKLGAIFRSIDPRSRQNSSVTAQPISEASSIPAGKSTKHVEHTTKQLGNRDVSVNDDLVTAIPSLGSDPSSPHPAQVDSTNIPKTLELDAKTRHSKPNAFEISQATEPGSQLSSSQPAETQPTTLKATPVVSRPLTEFTLFPKLAKELQIRVWQLSIQPRTVSFVPGGGKAPGTLSACRDSRNETRKRYRLLTYFPPQLPVENVRGMCTAIPPQFGVFINYEDDVIYWREATREFHKQCRSCSQPYATRNADAMSHCFTFFPLWSLPARRILFELPRRSLLRAIFLPTERSWSMVRNQWAAVFALLAATCPMLQEIILVPDKNPKLKYLEKMKPHYMVVTDPEDNRAYLAAWDAFELVQMLREKDYPDTETFDFKSEQEAARYIMDLPDGSRDLMWHWWARTPFLNFAKLKMLRGVHQNVNVDDP